MSMSDPIFLEWLESEEGLMKTKNGEMALPFRFCKNDR